MSPTNVGITGIVILLMLIALRMPIGFAMATVGFAGFSYLASVHAGVHVLFKEVFTLFSGYLLIAVPLFILMGLICFHAGIGERLYYTTHKWVGHLPGGLAMATISGCAGFAAISGVTVAAITTMGTVALPEMKKYNYQLELATGSIAAGGTLGILIPPSVTLLIYGIYTEQSIGTLFIAGIVPGILLTILFIISIYIRVRVNPRLAPPAPNTSFREKLSALWGVSEMVALFCLVMGGLFAGWFTPSEAGAVGAGGSIVLALSRRKLTREKFRDSFIDATKMTAMLFTIVIGAWTFSRFLAISEIPANLATWISMMQMSRFVTLAFMMVVYIIGGCFMDGISLMLLTIPIFYPLVIALGFDPIWFGIMIVVVTEVGLITPPVGINVFMLASVAKDVPLEVIFRGIVPFFFVLLVFLIILIAFPQIALFLPSLMG